MLTIRPGTDAGLAPALALHDDSGTDLQRDPVLESQRLDDEQLYLAEDDGELAGYLLGTFHGNWADYLLLPGHPMPQPFLHAVVVAPRYLRQGVATLLLQAFVDDARQLGRTAIASLPYGGNDSAVAWHYAVGFRLAEDHPRAQAVHATLDDLRLAVGRR